jgi:sugar/nucleoside kinase (ribokinase family)
LRERLGIAAVANATETAIMDIFYCAKPKKSTGAGDRFNAGYCLGLLLKLDARSRLVCANASAGFFVREARSASLPELAQFILTLSA